MNWGYNRLLTSLICSCFLFLLSGVTTLEMLIGGLGCRFLDTVLLKKDAESSFNADISFFLIAQPDDDVDDDDSLPSQG